MMKKLKLALVGLGNVGIHFVELLEHKGKTLREDHQLDLSLVGVIMRQGTVVAANGLDLPRLLDAADDQERLSSLPGFRPDQVGTAGILATDADVVVECTPTNLETGEPGLTHFRASLEAGKHVVTLTKGPLVVDWPEIKALARKHGVQVKFSGATAAALPTIDVAQYCLAGMEITEFRGILNGTTNYILTRMHQEGIDYETGLTAAQELGIAEPDPSLDVQGFDTAAKTVILANAVLDAGVTLDDVAVEGITKIRPDQIAAADDRDQVVKLVGSVSVAGEGFSVEVRPIELEKSHPLAQVHGTSKAVYFDSVEMGPLMVTGGKSDPRGAAAAALKDIVNLAREI